MNDFDKQVRIDSLSERLGIMQEQAEARDARIAELKAEVERLTILLKGIAKVADRAKERAEAAEARLRAVEGLRKYAFNAVYDDGDWIKYDHLKAALKEGEQP